MKKFSILAVAAAFIFNFSSCSNDEQLNDNPSLGESEALVITTDVSAPGLKSAKASISSFTSGASIGLFATTGTLPNQYYGNPANCKAVYSGTAWVQSPEIRLTAANATIYAYYPYNSMGGNGTQIPVDHLQKIDYMYGTHTVGQGGINKNNPRVNLTMKHALALLQFKINKTNYPWSGKLTRIEVANASGKTVLYSEGMMNAEIGIITPIVNKNQPASITQDPLLIIPDVLPNDEKDYVELLVLPIASTGNEGDVVISFTIDNRIYTWKVAANTTWNGGTKNTYTVTISGSALQIGDVVITDWTDGVKGDVAIFD